MDVPIDPQQSAQQPSPPVSGFGDLAAALQASVTQNQQQPSSAPVSSPAPQAAQQQTQPSQGPPRPHLAMVDLIRGLVSPRSVSMDQRRPVSRADVVFDY